MTTFKTLSRRQFLCICMAAGESALLVACAEQAPQAAPTASPVPPLAVNPTPLPATVAPSPVPPTAVPAAAQYSEAPMLAELVSTGKLQTVEQRLPSKPLQVEVVEQIGTYGGDWMTGWLGAADSAWLTRTGFYDGLVRWSPDWKKVVPNVAESWQISADATTYTFKLRHWLKWSDGKPFTSADILFWVEDMIGDSELYPGGQPNWMRVNGQPAVVTAPDSATIIFTFAGPHGLFLQILATPERGIPMVDAQAEYAKQWHRKYNPEINKLVEEAKLATWVELFNSKVTTIPSRTPNARIHNPDLPTLAAWRLLSGVTAGPQMIAERNPYYWKVDANGQQLPYLDRIIYQIFPDKPAIIQAALAGKIDMQDRHIATSVTKADFLSNQAKGGYRLYETTPSFMNTSVIALNLTHKDPVKREIFNNKLFRKALSVAINRQEIIDTIYKGQGIPTQPAPRPESEFYDEEMTTQFIDHFPDQAAAWLDEAGYKLGPQGVRLGPDGKPIAFNLEVPNNLPDVLAVMKLVATHWKAVGIEVTPLDEDRALFYTRKAANDHDAGVWYGDGGLEVLLEPRWYFPFSEESIHGEAWQYWFNNPKDSRAEEPPAEIKKQMELYQQIHTKTDPEEQAKLMREILVIARDSFYVMGISLEVSGYGIVKNNFHNVPKKMFFSWLYPSPSGTHPEQYYKDSPR